MPATWRLIDSGPLDAAYNMALDEALAFSVRTGQSPPTLRLYTWQSPSVSIGRFQRINSINHTLCCQRHIPLVRRPTGGRAVLHASELTYSFSAPATVAPFSGGLWESYHLLASAFSRAFTLLGLSPSLHDKKKSPQHRSPVCFSAPSYGEFTVNGRKCIGQAQRHWAGNSAGLLQQGSLPLDIDYAEIAEFFGGAPGEHASAMVGIRELLPDVTLEGLKLAVRQGFEVQFGASLAQGAPSAQEIALADRLEREKYLAPAWTAQR